MYLYWVLFHVFHDLQLFPRAAKSYLCIFLDLTHCSDFAKEEVDNSKISFKWVVAHSVLK